ncbi:nitrous oxide reductase accessory protein NosL [Bacillus tianshenii]|nr:nitrous oxide reductase accessory protein NosL [Bacillus tianshenii]
MYKRLFLLGAILLLMSGCGKEKEVQPREIKPEVDACVVCQMSIVHTDFATQIVEQNGESHIFDDLGCMMEYMEKQIDEEDVAGAFVKDLEDGDWIKMNEAVYVYDEEFWTPMAYGVVSFSSKEKAEAYIAEQKKGKLLQYEDLKTFDWGF